MSGGEAVTLRPKTYKTSDGTLFMCLLDDRYFIRKTLENCVRFWTVSELQHFLFI